MEHLFIVFLFVFCWLIIKQIYEAFTGKNDDDFFASDENYF